MLFGSTKIISTHPPH